MRYLASSAYAVDVTTAGRVRWQVPLAGPIPGSRLSPLAVGAVAVFAQGDILYGLRLADGHQIWSRPVGQSITDMWRWQNLVIVLNEGVPGGWPLLIGLDAYTGQVRWGQAISEDADGLYPTADGNLAILRGDGTLEVVDLSSGRIRWTRPTAAQEYPLAMAVADGAVLCAVNGKLTSYDDRTGRIRWTDSLLPIVVATDMGWLGLQATGGLVYLTGGVLHLASGYSTPVLLGISAADGRVKWRFAPSSQETLSNYAPALMSVTSSSGQTWQDELDPSTGRVRWQVASGYDAIPTSAGIVTAPGSDGTDEISVHGTLTGETRWTVRLAGLNLGWQQQAPSLPVFPVGSLLVVPAVRRSGPDLVAALRTSDGRRAWQVTIAAPVFAPPSAVPGGMLIYAADFLLAP